MGDWELNLYPAPGSPNLRKAAVSSKCELIRAVSAIMCPRNAPATAGSRKTQGPQKWQMLPPKEGGSARPDTASASGRATDMPHPQGTAEWQRQGPPNTAQSFTLVLRSTENKAQRRDNHSANQRR